MAKTIVFCVDSEHADQMRAALHRAERRPRLASTRTTSPASSPSKATSGGHLGNFADVESETPVIATTSKLLSTGVDLPTVKNIVLFKPVGSMVEFKQIIGRGTRLYPDADKLSFEIIDYSGATALFEDPDFDGPPEQIVDEEIDELGLSRSSREKLAKSTRVRLDLEHDGLSPTEPTAIHRKFYVDGAEVAVTAEGFYLLDTETGRLRLVEYRDYVASTVREMFSGSAELREHWRTRPGRNEVAERLAAQGVSLEELAERTRLSDADPVDVLGIRSLECAGDVTTRPRHATRTRPRRLLRTFRPGSPRRTRRTSREVRRIWRRSTRRPSRARSSAANVIREPS